jgi:hypothetical protein
VRSFLSLFLLFVWAHPCVTLAAPAKQAATPSIQTQAQAQDLVERAVSAEMRTAQDASHPMRYRLRKSSPRLTTVKEIFETRDGAVARLLSIGDKPLSAADEEQERARLEGLLSDPGRQRHRKQNEDADTGHALKVLRALPQAFLYEFAGTGWGPAGKVEKFTFKPNPHFSPPDLETQVLTAMAGEIWIDASQMRVTRLEGHLQQDIDFGWGVLGRLNKGGWIVIEQADVGGHQWRIVRFQMVMSGRVLFKNKSFDTVEEQTQFEPLPAGLGYRQAIQMLRSGMGSAGQAGR